MKFVYTDGACPGNPGPGGWAWVVPNGSFASGAELRATNQRMELRAALEAVWAYDRGELGAGPLHVISDSEYVVKCFRDGWWKKWIRNGWRNSSKKPVVSRELWEPLIETVRTRGDVTFEWVKGHSANAWNERADELAGEAARNQMGRRG